jgi:WD40 repeat protein
VLRKHCTACHNARNLKEADVSGGLALDTYEVIRKGGKKLDAELLARLVSKDAEKRMPLNAPPLPDETVTLLRRWIESGAKEGTKPDGEPGVVAVTPTRTRKLDVVLGTGAVPPKGVFGAADPAKLDLVLPVGPLAPVAAVAFSPDGKLLAAGSYGRVTVWDLAAARPLKVLTNVLGAVNDLRFSPDGKVLAVAGGQPSAKGDLRIYQASDWKLLASLGGHDDVVFSVAFSPDGRRLASASFDKMVCVWDWAAHKVEQKLSGHSDFVYAVAFGPDGKWLASASKDRSVKVVETATGKSLYTFSGMNEDALAVAVNPDGKAVVGAGFEPAVKWWNPQTGERVRQQAGHGVAVHELAFSPDGKLLVSAGADRTVRLWDGATGAPLKSFAVGSIAYAAAVSPDSRLVASGSFDGQVRLWDVASGRQLLTLLAPDDKHWLALAPEGYAAGSPELQALGRWRMAGKDVAVWPSLLQPDLVARAARGETVPAPTFGK